MGFFSRDIKTLNDLFIRTLRDIYYAEKKIAKAFPIMVDKATDNGLKGGFERHLDQTEVHIERLEKAFQMLGAEARTADCPAIDGILDEAEEIAATSMMTRSWMRPWSRPPRRSSIMRSPATVLWSPGRANSGALIAQNCSHRPSLKRGRPTTA